MGLADVVVDPAALETVAVETARALAEGSLKGKRKGKGLLQKVLEDTSMGRSIVYGQTEKMVAKNTGGHYPAPTAILDTIKYGFTHSKPQALEYEATRFAELAATSVSAALRGIFTGTTALKQSKYGKPANPVETVAVVGAGLMGAGIAQVTAEKGYRVLLKDKDLAGVSRGEKYISDNLKGKMKKKRMTKYAYDTTTSRVVGLTDESANWGKQFGKADMVIEAVFEDLSLKHKVIQQLEEHLPPHAVFASNTSAIPIARIAEASRRPENVIGMHYFSPVPQMPLLEIIPHKGTSNAAAAAAFEVGKKQGKTVIFVKDVPGFYVNRCLGPYLVETGALMEAGVPLEQLDKAIKAYGFPVGPITLADEVGVDVAAHVQAFLSKADLGVRMGGSDGPILDALLKAKLLGRKAGKGFYTYPAGGKKEKGPKTLNPEATSLVQKYVKGESKLTDEEVQNRLVSRFVNEAVFALQDGVIASPVEGDIGAVFGIGFPPFLGGPFRLIDAMGAGKYCSMLEGFAGKYGEQFAPAPLLVEHAKSGKKFHQ
ncbi:hypothetical protein NSK_004631 [Nannochloropsis salina CCMP1776]|uniref:Enoyl-CoA hydratase n=1 Tax=Nannochloropsis salina CCMP1776 TaxID=1027361 RepID=A0A4D9D6F1_9STRA|nr:hypothetical protein NSK_004631 [Nannochloropsis salina CCMP1776]|eukprot:TFJ84159.1 hypothetical protein NSK_004631 [Nannochloropsis salina CCMP1776]